MVQLGPWPPPYGGVQTHIVALRRRMEARGIASEVINITSAPRGETPGVWYPRSAPSLLWTMLRRRADVLHLHLGGQLSPRLVALAALCTVVPRSRSVLTFHSGGFPSSPEGLGLSERSVPARVFQRFDAIVVVNTEQKAFFERLGCEPSRVQLILPYANPDPEAVARGELPPDVEEFLARHQHVVVTIGLLEPEYQLDLVISALPELRRVAGDIGLVIVGSGSLETELRGVIQRSPERAHVALLGDLAHAATLRLLLRADTMIRATKFDGDAISVREALALGTPVAATHTGMRPPGCHLFQVGSLEGLVTAVSRAMASPRRVFPSADELDRVVELYRVLAA